jgi:hypothetical protein
MPTSKPVIDTYHVKKPRDGERIPLMYALEISDGEANTVTHTHDGHQYTYAFYRGHLVRRITDVRWEWVLPQTAPVQDEETGEWCDVDPAREAYIAALIVVLRTTEKQSAHVATD